MLLAVCLLTICNLALSLPASTQRATYITFDPPGSTDTEPQSINRHGTITGFYYAPTVHSFVR
ncbi:MAG TPA: hypothetical protein VFV92_10080, partial [Candidatus Bathyarchaeia archaeon]|nr:hypothetical protein [Candidatus Bathyarchaeia archaeon]